MSQIATPRLADKGVSTAILMKSFRRALARVPFFKRRRGGGCVSLLVEHEVLVNLLASSLSCRRRNSPFGVSLLLVQIRVAICGELASLFSSLRLLLAKRKAANKFVYFGELFFL